MTLTKAHIIEAIHKELVLPKNLCIELVETLLETIKKSLGTGEDVLISGFGKFCVKKKKKRRGRNPATGRDLILNERKVVTFKCSHLLRKKIDS